MKAGEIADIFLQHVAVQEHDGIQRLVLRWERQEGTHQIGFHDQRGKAANKPTLGKREANATPLEFRDELLRLAMKAHNDQHNRPASAGPG